VTSFFPYANRPPTFVLDVSVTVVWKLVAHGTQFTDAVLRRLYKSGAAVPVGWPVEVADGVMSAGEPAAEVDRFLNGLRSFSVHLDDQHEPRVWTATVPLTRQIGLPVARAAYLHLALRLNLPLATIDPALVSAAPVVGVALMT
jgi:predicted nucleic acid-binding protein